MVGVFSHSKLGLYESCPAAYKAKYIDKVWPDVPKSIELFLGEWVHASLEWLYHEVSHGEEIELDDLIRHFADNWKNNYSFDIRIRNGGTEEYMNKGVKFLIDYYQKHKPFVDGTIETEKKIEFPLDEEGKYKVIGYIDRIVKKDDGSYEVHDYKTNSVMKKQEEVDKDRQLAFYHLGMKEIFGGDIHVDLVWHFLAFNEDIVSKRNQDELEDLKKQTLKLIKKIENESEWPACGKPWCDWCAYQQVSQANGEDKKDKNVSFRNVSLNKYFID